MLDARYIRDRIDAILKIVDGQSGPGLEQAILRLATMRSMLLRRRASIDVDTEVEFQSLLQSHPAIRRAYLLSITSEMRQRCLEAIDEFANIKKSRQLTEEELSRLAKAEEHARTCDALDRDTENIM